MNLYYPTTSDLANAAQDVSLGDARSQEANFAELAEAAKAEADIARLGFDAITAGRQAAFDCRNRIEAELQSAAQSAYEATILHGGSEEEIVSRAQAFAARQTAIKFLRDATLHSDNVLRPAAYLTMLTADATGLRADANHLMSRALTAAILRHQAAAQLVAVDGHAVLSPAGRAHNLWRAGIEAWRRVAEAQNTVEAEITRQQIVKDQKIMTPEEIADLQKQLAAFAAEQSKTGTDLMTKPPDKFTPEDCRTMQSEILRVLKTM